MALLKGFFFKNVHSQIAPKWLIKLIAQEESDDDSDGEEESDDDDDDDDDSSEEESPAKAPVLNGKAKKVNPSIVSIVHSSK